MLPLQLGKHDEINHAVLVLRERTFGIVVLPDNLFRIGNGLFDGKLFETLVPFLQCPDSDNNASKLLRDFANMHFSDLYGLVKATHEEEYQKRHERLEERIKEMKKAEKKAAREAEKQQTAEKKTTAPKTEKPESGKAA